MTIRDKISERNTKQSIKDKDFLNHTMLRVTGIILAGYFIGTAIALFIEKIK